MIRQAGDSGFTLLETLLGLTLTAMVAFLMMGSLQLGARVWERGDGRDTPLAGHVLDNRIGEWLAQAMPAGIYDPSDTEASPFQGMASSASWIVAGEGLGGPAGIYRVDLLLVETAGCDGRSLSVRIQLVSPDGQLAAVDEVGPVTRVLTSCLRDPSFAFFGVADGEDHAAWRSEWTGQGRLPLVVQLRAEDADASSRVVFSHRLARASR